MHYRAVWTILRDTFVAWNEHEAPRLGAALAFYTILSLAPLVILVIAIGALIFGHSAAQGQLLAQVDGLIGRQGSEAVGGMIEHAQKPASGAFASIAGVITLLFGASGVFGELRSALNLIWDVKPAGGAGLWGTLRERFFSLGMVLAVGFLLLVSLVVSAALATLGKFFGGVLPMPGVRSERNQYPGFTGGNLRPVRAHFPICAANKDAMEQDPGGGDRHRITLYDRQVADWPLPGKGCCWFGVLSGRFAGSGYRLGVLLSDDFSLRG